MLVVISYYVFHTSEAKSYLFSLRHIKGSHLGENIVQLIIAIMEEYRIKDLLRYFALNNVLSNDTCV
jgi:hypothetical protein